MEIGEFLELCAGKWFSQRTSYHFEKQQVDNSKSELTIEWLSGEHPEVISFCQQYSIDPQKALGGKKVSWDNSVDSGKPKQLGSNLIILVPDETHSQSGKLLRKINPSQPTLLAGRYDLGKDEALTLTLELETTYTEERVWFASPNLRLRTSIVKSVNGLSQNAFYSEIRKLPPKTE